MHPGATKEKEALDIRETGLPLEGQPQTSNSRLYCQLYVFDECHDPSFLKKALETAGFDSVIYLDMNNPFGVALLLMNEKADFFVEEARTFLMAKPFASLKPRPEFTMLGRTYSSGREADLEDWLLRRTKRVALNPETPWAVWYPLRRKPEFALLSGQDQGKILFEHSTIGRAYGEAGFASDIRLACYGIDQNDNEFILGLIGKELYPLSRLVQEMRKTEQTAKYIQNLGPFFIGKVYWQSPLKA